jgi:integrase/recombinase XerD
MNQCRERRATYLFESNCLKPFSTRRIRQIIHQYASEAGIEKRVYPHLFRPAFPEHGHAQGEI